MIRFVDMTEAYWGGDEEPVRSHPCCAFINTVNDRFIDVDGSHMFDGDADIGLLAPPLAARLRMLVPEGFWSRQP